MNFPAHLLALLLAPQQAAPAVSLVAEAGARFRAGQYAAAIELYEKAAGLGPLGAPHRFTLAMAYIAVGRRIEARRELEALPPNAHHVYWLGRLHAADADYAAAIETYKRALAFDPEFSRAYDGMGLAYEALGNFAEAEKAYRAAIRANSSRSPWPHQNLGVMLMKLERRDEAESCFRQALALLPAFSQAHYQLGRIHELRGQPDEALARYREGARNADYPDVYYALYRLLKKRGDEAGAGQALQQFRRLGGK